MLAITTVTTTAAVNPNTWYLLEMFYDGTQWTPIINGVTYTSITTNIPVVPVNIGIMVENVTGGGSKSVHVDYFSMITRELGARY